ncbi:DsbA family protein [Fertoebacter nigrum]|uniref:DsbA family protein n=1 Tax=Fertoeibacter niger TaxID=2656921 RepID=A0A8X8H9U3_9RHOB|nr:DsbA family protein [Fertoeibacter niger]NUB46336.1 DsbA family protein [Fertoeibacter niger]
MAKKLGLAALALVVAGGLGLWAFGGAGVQTAGQSLLPVTAAMAQETGSAPAEAPAETPVVPDMVMGNADAKVTLTEYASYTCPHCATFHASVFKQVKAEYIDTGKVKFVLREVYFDRYGLWAAMVARCGGEMRYFGISDILFNTQQEWAASDDAMTVVENLRKIGRTAGMDDATLNACLEDGAMAQALVTTYQANAEADDVQSTPTLLVNGEKHGNMSYEELKTILDAALEG